MHKVLITGGAGLIGSHLVDELLARHLVTQITIYDNLHRGRIANLQAALTNSRVHFVKADVRDEETLARHSHDVDTIFHLAGQSNVAEALTNLDYTLTTNVTGTLNILRQAQQSGARVFFSSSREVYGEPHHLPVPETAVLRAKNIYGASKIAAEMLCHAYQQTNLSITTLRLANVYGPRDIKRVIPIFTQRALHHRPITIYGGQQIIDFVWVGDVVNTFIEAALRATPITNPVNVGTGQGTTLPELATRIIQTTQSTSAVNIIPGRDFEVERFTADLTTFNQLFTHTPSPPLAHLAEVIQYWQGQ